jgi:uncharacterized protein (DUF488 family)
MEFFTIGYEGLNIDRFLSLLKKHSISVVADVRHLPLSRKKGFSKTALANSLSESDIDYVSASALGTPKQLRNELKETGNYRTFFDKYRTGLESKFNHIDKIRDMVNEGEKVALLCFERDATKCHRSVLSEMIKKRDGNGLKVKHIIPAY